MKGADYYLLHSAQYLTFSTDSSSSIIVFRYFFFMWGVSDSYYCISYC